MQYPAHALRPPTPHTQAWQVYEAACQQPSHRKAAHSAYMRKVELGWLSAPGVPGPNAARAGGPPFRPLKRTKVAEEHARAEAEAAAARAEEQQRAAEAAAQQQAEEAASASAAAMEQWEQEQEQEQEGLQEEEGWDEQASGRSHSKGGSSGSESSSSDDRSSSSRRSGSGNSRSGRGSSVVRSQQERQLWHEDDDGSSLENRNRRDSSSKGVGARRSWTEDASDEDVGAPVLPTAYDLDDIDDKDE